ARLIAGVFAGRVRVQRAAQPLQRQRDLVRAPPPRALEHHVLEEMADAHLAGRLVHGPRMDPYADRCRADARHLLRQYDEPVAEIGTREAIRLQDPLRARPCVTAAADPFRRWRAA